MKSQFSCNAKRVWLWVQATQTFGVRVRSDESDFLVSGSLPCYDSQIWCFLVFFFVCSVFTETVHFFTIRMWSMGS